jgi:hypothetical protein
MLKIIFIISICASSFLLAQTSSNKNLLIKKNNIEIEYSKAYNENIINFKYGLTKNIELIPIGFRYRFINDGINQSLIQLNLLSLSSGSSSSSWDNNGSIETESSSNDSVEVFGKMIYKITPLNKFFSTQLEYSNLYQINSNSEYGSKNENIQQFSLEQFYYFYENYSISVKGSYLDGNLYENNSSGYDKNIYVQKMIELNLYLPIAQNIDIVGSYQNMNSTSDKILNPYSYNETDKSNNQYFGFKVLYRLNPSPIISFFRF